MDLNKVDNKHICTLEGEGAEAFRPDSYITSFTRILEIWKGNPNAKHFYSSLAEIENERRMLKELKASWLIIHPFSIFRYSWECLQLGFLFIGFIVIPLNMIFGPMMAPRLIRLGLCDTFESIEFICDIVYIVDVLMLLVTGYPIYGKEIVLFAYKSILSAYTSSKQFYVDLVSMISVTIFVKMYIMWGANPENITWIVYIKISALLKYLRLVRFLIYYRHTTRYLDGAHLQLLKVKYILVCMIFLHLLTCMYIAIEQYLLIYSTFDADVVVWSTTYPMIPLLEYSDMYVTAFHYIISNILSIQMERSFGFIQHMQNIWIFEVITFIFLAIAGFIATSVITLLLVQIIIALNSPETKYHAVINQVQAYMDGKEMPKEMQKRMISYYDYAFQKSYYRSADISDNLSAALNRDIGLHSCRALIEVVAVLNELPVETLTGIVPLLKHKVYLYNDTIIHAHAKDNCMYFICRGTVQIQTPTGREICHLQDGAYFGEIALILPNQKRVANVIAIEVCEVYKLERADFMRCFEEASPIYKRIEMNARVRRNKTVLLERLHAKFMLDRTTKRRARGVTQESTKGSNFRF